MTGSNAQKMLISALNTLPTAVIPRFPLALAALAIYDAVLNQSSVRSVVFSD